jgi:hypothetical protein
MSRASALFDLLERAGPRVQEDVGSRSRQFESNGPADATRGAGDDRHLAFQLAH